MWLAWVVVTQIKPFDTSWSLCQCQLAIWIRLQTLLTCSNVFPHWQKCQERLYQVGPFWVSGHSMVSCLETVYIRMSHIRLRHWNIEVYPIVSCCCPIESIFLKRDLNESLPYFSCCNSRPKWWIRPISGSLRGLIFSAVSLFFATT